MQSKTGQKTTLQQNFYMKTLSLIADIRYLSHLTGPGHPESPARFHAIMQKIESEGLLEKVSQIPPRHASEEDILQCHTAEYYALVKEEVANLKNYEHSDGRHILSTGDAHISPASLDCALLSAGAALVAVDNVILGKNHSSLSLGRPPGHHATQDKGMGFCIFNNIAIAARYAQREYGIQKILIIDWDVHHGNGTQDIFYEDPSIFYFSTHRKDFYPGTGFPEEKGAGKGLGTTLNVAISPDEKPREKILDSFQNLLPQIVASFSPELIMVSAGFDAHRLDPLGGFDLTEKDFGELTKLVLNISLKECKKGIVSLLEGGYSLEGLSSSVVEHIKHL